MDGRSIDSTTMCNYTEQLQSLKLTPEKVGELAHELEQLSAAIASQWGLLGFDDGVAGFSGLLSVLANE